MGHAFGSDRQLTNKCGVAPEEFPSPTAPGKARGIAVGFVIEPVLRTSSERRHWSVSPSRKQQTVLAENSLKPDGLLNARAWPGLKQSQPTAWLDTGDR